MYIPGRTIVVTFCRQSYFVKLNGFKIWMINFTIEKIMESNVVSLRGKTRVVLVQFSIATHCRALTICQLLAKQLQTRSVTH